MNALDVVLNGLMDRYKNRVPDVNKVTDALLRYGIIESVDEVGNDHIAFRTMGVPNLGIQSFEKIFLHYGYTARDQYRFEAKKLDARWYAPPDPKYPRIFISELCVNELPVEIQEVIRSYTDEVVKDPVDELDLNDGKAVDAYLHQPLWRTPALSDYKKLQAISEYAAWVIYNRYYLNHYTLSVHDFNTGYNTLEEFNLFLESIGVVLNDSGSKIKMSPDELLLQSSSVSNMVEAVFEGGEKYLISGSYVEFIERRILPQFKHLDPDVITSVHRREGFEAGNADKIFESTYTEQTKKRD